MNTVPDLATKSVAQQIALASIRTDDGSQGRVKIREAVVRAYAAAMKQQLEEGGLQFPAIVLFWDDQAYWISDGFHRILAARRAGLTDFLAEVRPGTQRDALLHAISANTEHGLQRTRADKRKAVALLLKDPEWSEWSDREIARRCQVSQSFVTKLRRKLSDLGDQIRPRKVKRGDTVYQMRARAPSGQTRVSDQPASMPNGGPLGAPASDRVGIPLPADTAPAFASLGLFEAAGKLHAELVELVDQLARSPGGAAYRPNLLSRLKDGKPAFYAPELNVFAQKLGSAAPFCGYCPRCQASHSGRVHSACKLCRGRGWLSKGEYEACPEHERQDLKRLQNQTAER